MKTLRIVLVALAAMAAGVVTSADGQTLLLTLDTPNPGWGPVFGYSVAVGDVNGDGKGDIAVGACLEDVGTNTHQGRAYVFSGADGSLLLTLDTPNPQAHAWFGEVVAVGEVNGDGKADMAVWGYEDVGGNRQGRAYVFSGADGSLLFTLETASGVSEWLQTGRWLAVGDVNGDGNGDIGVGAYRENVGGGSYGRAYVFSGADGSLLFTLDSPHLQDGGFGYSVAVGEVNGDDKGDIVVGAFHEDVNGTYNQGRAYVFSGADGSLLFTLDTPNPQAYGGFGSSVAVGDVNGDGKGDIAVGADAEDVDGNAHQGRAYVFSGADGSLVFTLDTPTPQANGRFGGSLAVGDVNADGKGDMAVGAYSAPVHVFSGADGSLLFTLDPNGSYSSRFGCSVAVGDVNGDGNPDIAVGAPHKDVGGNPDQGRAYVFSSPPVPVGGIAELPEVSDSSGRNYIALAGLAAAALVTLGAGAWYARRRWLS